VYVEEYKRELNDREHEIHAGVYGVTGAPALPEAKRQRYLAMWRGEAVPPSERAAARRKPVRSLPVLPCSHRGESIRDEGGSAVTVGCRSCGGGTRKLKLYACGVHERCTLDGSSPGVASCATCKDRVEPAAVQAVFPPITTRNLLAHVYPVAGNGVWQRNVRQLVRRIGLFNGRRVVAIMLDAAIDPPAKVRAEFAGCGDVEFIELRNDAQLREVASFLPLFESVESTDPTQATLYIQAKGVTRPADHTSHLWTEILYETHLDYWGFVERLLRQFPIAGAFKKLGAGWSAEQTQSDWHYSGSWLWFRNDQLFSKPDWRTIDQFWSGIEPYPSLHFRPHEAGELFMSGTMPSMQLYPTGEPNTGWNYITRTVMPALVRWRAEHQADWRAWP
jgi:hypothetical protein